MHSDIYSSYLYKTQAYDIPIEVNPYITVAWELCHRPVYVSKFDYLLLDLDKRINHQVHRCEVEWLNAFNQVKSRNPVIGPIVPCSRDLVNEKVNKLKKIEALFSNLVKNYKQIRQLQPELCYMCDSTAFYQGKAEIKELSVESQRNEKVIDLIFQNELTQFGKEAREFLINFYRVLQCRIIDYKIEEINESCQKLNQLFSSLKTTFQKEISVEEMDYQMYALKRGGGPNFRTSGL